MLLCAPVAQRSPARACACVQRNQSPSADGQRQERTINAHEHALAALAFNSLGTRLATASGTGTVIRVFSVPDGQRIAEFSRGVARCASPPLAHTLAHIHQHTNTHLRARVRPAGEADEHQLMLGLGSGLR